MLGRKIVMSILAWIVLGLVAGFLGSKLVNKTGEGFFLDIVLGVVGAVVGGYIFSLFGAHGVTGLNLYSLLVAVVGSVVVFVLYHIILGSRRTSAGMTTRVADLKRCVKYVFVAQRVRFSIDEA